MIRKINSNDLEKIKILGRKYDKMFSNKYLLKGCLNDNVHYAFCFEEDDVIKGFIIFTLLYENVEIELLFVDNQYRNKNIGTSLIKYIFDNYKNKNVLLEVSLNNIPALSLYKKMGFIEVGKRQKYYNGVDAILMKKVI